MTTAPDDRSSRSATQPRVVALVLAAGSSRRLGSPKALVTQTDGRTLLARAAHVARAAGFAVAVAVPAGGGAVAEVARRLIDRERAAGAVPWLDETRVIEVADPSAGMSASLRAGTTALAADPAVGGILILPVDQWRVTADDLRALIGAWEANGRTVAAARYAGTTGAPAVFGRRHFQVLAGTSGDAGAREYLRSDRSDVTPVDVPNAAFDLDTPEDLLQVAAPE